MLMEFVFLQNRHLLNISKREAWRKNKRSCKIIYLMTCIHETILDLPSLYLSIILYQQMRRFKTKLLVLITLRLNLNQSNVEGNKIPIPFLHMVVPSSDRFDSFVFWVLFVYRIVLFRSFFLFDYNAADERWLLETRVQHIDICNIDDFIGIWKVFLTPNSCYFLTELYTVIWKGIDNMHLAIRGAIKMGNLPTTFKPIINNWIWLITSRFISVNYSKPGYIIWFFFQTQERFLQCNQMYRPYNVPMKFIQWIIFIALYFN